MDETKTLLEQAVVGVEPTEGGYERVLRRRRHRERRSRLATIGIALAVAAAGTRLAFVAFDDRLSPTPRPGSVSLRELSVAWTAMVPTPGFPIVEIAHDDHVVVASTQDATLAFEKDCGSGGTDCAPLWRAERRGLPSPVVWNGIVYEGSERGVLAFSTRCASDGGACQPLWIGTVPDGTNAGASDVLVSEGVVSVTYSFREGEHHRVYTSAYPAECGTGGERCHPLWTGFVGSGTLSLPSAAVEGVVFRQVGSQVVGFDVRCRADGERCEPSVVWMGAGMDAVGPVAGLGEALFVNEHELVALPMTCPESQCSPLWTADLGGFSDAEPLVSGDRVVITEGRNVLAFRAGCRRDGGSCEPLWRAEVSGVRLVSTRYADASIVVVGSHFGDPGRFWVFPSSCSGSCQPLWNGAVPGGLGEVVSSGEELVIGTQDGRLFAYERECRADGGTCSPTAEMDIAGRYVTDILIDESGMYVLAVSSGGLDEAGSAITALRP